MKALCLFFLMLNTLHAAEPTAKKAQDKTAEEKSASAPAIEPAPAPIANLFPTQTWQPPPPPPPPPAKPKAPVLPFKFGGFLLEQGGEMMAFLTNGQRQVIAKQGEVIDNTYRVEAVLPGHIEFTYLPLKETQRLITGTQL